MSFRDLESGSSAVSGASDRTSAVRHNSARQQPKQCNGSIRESSFEKSIKANIQEMQDGVRQAVEHLERAQRGFQSKRSRDGLDKLLERSRELSHQTEQLFQDWTVHLAGEPSERHRKKFSFDKLQKAFEEEVIHLRDAVRKAVTAHQETARSGSTCLKAENHLDAVIEDQTPCSSAGHIGEEDELLGEGNVETADVTLRQRIAAEREEGIRRIHGQVAEVNQIFRDLATIVAEQGQQFETIEHQAASSATQTKETVHELKKVVDRQRGSRERLCCMLLAAVVILCFVVIPHLHAGLHAPVVRTNVDTIVSSAGAVEAVTVSNGVTKLDAHQAAKLPDHSDQSLALRRFGTRTATPADFAVAPSRNAASETAGVPKARPDSTATVVSSSGMTSRATSSVLAAAAAKASARTSTAAEADIPTSPV